MAMAGIAGGDLKLRVQRIIPDMSYLMLTPARKLALAVTAVSVISMPVAAGAMNARYLNAQSKQQLPSSETSDSPKAFEVATVRPSRLTPGCFSTLPPGGVRFRVTCASLRVLISIAYKIDSNRIDGPSKELDRLYDVNATTDDQALRGSDVGPMLQTLLTERFHLQIHTVQRPVSGFELVAANGGSKLKKTAVADINAAQSVSAGKGSPNFIAPGMIQGTAANMQTIAALLSIPAGGPVVDKTELKGYFDVSLHFAPIDDKDSELPSFFTAVEEQLGLKLRPAKVPTTFLVISHIDSEPVMDQ